MTSPGPSVESDITSTFAIARPRSGLASPAAWTAAASAGHIRTTIFRDSPRRRTADRTSENSGAVPVVSSISSTRRAITAAISTTSASA
jgi:hypothetical protein